MLRAKTSNYVTRKANGAFDESVLKRVVSKSVCGLKVRNCVTSLEALPKILGENRIFRCSYWRFKPTILFHPRLSCLSFRGCIKMVNNMKWHKCWLNLPNNVIQCPSQQTLLTIVWAHLGLFLRNSEFKNTTMYIAWLKDEIQSSWLSV